jgi:acyl-CoA thioester hydrolase
VSRFRYLCPMRWGDLDAQAHVNNAAYLDYLQEARVEFLLTGPPVMQDLLKTGVLVVSHQVEYLRPVAFDGEPIMIELWVQSVGASRFMIGYEMLYQEQLVARARTAAVPFDLAHAGLRRLNPAEREHLTAQLAPEEPLRAMPKARVSENAHRFDLRVRWSDLDSYGHVNNVKFYDYVQEARIALMVEALGFSLEQVSVIVRQDLEYVRPMDFRRDSYEIASSVSAIGTRSFTLEIEIRDPLVSPGGAAGTVFATARSVVVGAVPLSTEERAALMRWGAF